MLFYEIIGQHAVKQSLADLVAHNRLSHALLFLGKEGNGSLQLALAFSQYLLCEKVTRNTEPPSLFEIGPIETPQLPKEACGVCSSCVKASQLIHPDIHYSYPVIPKKTGTPPISTDYITEWREFIKLYPYGNLYDWLQFIDAENRQGNITANECNDIIRKLNLKSFESGYKILVMWMPEFLGKEGNKLLKLIEEPPPQTLFILVAENEEQLLPTIISRCQVIRIPVLNDNEIAVALENRNKTGPVQSRQVAGISEGNYRQALNLVQHSDEDWSGLLKDWISFIYRRNLPGQVKWIDEMSKSGREKQKQFLRYFNHMLEQAIRLRSIGAAQLQLTDSDLDFATRLNKIGDIGQHEAIIYEIDQASYYIERNANAKMLFHALTIRLAHIIHNNIVLLA